MLVFYFIIIFINWRHVRADCGVVTRNEWGSLNVSHVEYIPRPVHLVIIQHTVSPFCETDQECSRTVRTLQDNHVNKLKYPDIGKSFVVGGNGKIYEGTGWFHVGSHTFGYNKRSIGISFIGDYNNREATAQQLEAVKSLLRCGVEHGHLAPDFHVVGQKQVISTQSPGRYLYEQIRTWPEWTETEHNV